MSDTSIVDSTYRVTADELRQFVERWERLDQESRDITEGKAEVFAEAKGRGYDTKVMRKIIARRKRDPQDLAEEDAIFELYEEAMGSGSGHVWDEDDIPARDPEKKTEKKRKVPHDPTEGDNELDDDAVALI